jgi:predicted GNAT family acetyltransferase
MYRKIDKNNSVFNDSEFQKDKYKFNIILKNLPSPELELYSDEENYIICRGSKGWPTWIWTKDNFDKTKIEEIEELIRMYLTDNEKDKFTCKKELYDLLVKREFPNLNKDDYFEMGFLICHETKKPKECDGLLSKPTEDDRSVLEQYWYDDNIEMNGVDPITMEQSKKDVDNFLKDDKFYVLKNPLNKIVCMVTYTVIDNQAKISHVYTPVEERGKGYAANIIYLVTNDLLKKGLVPLLYTDYNYIPSNKAYINAGYEDTGILINFSCSK